MEKLGSSDSRQNHTADEWQTVAHLAFHAVLLSAVALLFLLHFPSSLTLRLLGALSGSLAALAALCLLRSAAAAVRSSLAERTARRMVAAVPDWSAVRTALDVGCGASGGTLLSAVARQMKKEGSGGRVVGVDRRRETAVAVLRRAGDEGVREHVTCREGDARRLPFADGYFDLVVSASRLKKAEEGVALAELVRVLKPGGVGVVWGLLRGPWYAQRLRDMRMEDIRLADAGLRRSHIVSFHKPMQILEQDQFNSPAAAVDIC
ncbi:demethylmenaquinone methyltransferase-like [Zingiber officinale]|uniref:Methyltransferase type 11 domain-containing protein n=1 Tax=Zingiber officinale TaxID=94328 RepID=A0A8J5LCH3_ZINOF|nr:demethylmenaquinone methyltransferase-like [Zingiber officinale]KAG6508446.1 hypothetical protein ZIOFF_033820 [Zingiber officinale]